LLKSNTNTLSSEVFADTMISHISGPNSEYKKGHSFGHTMQVSVVAECMSKFSRNASEARREAYLAVWTYVTRHTCYLEGWDDERWMGDSGVMNVNGIQSHDIFN